MYFVFYQLQYKAIGINNTFNSPCLPQTLMAANVCVSVSCSFNDTFQIFIMLYSVLIVMDPSN